MDTALTLLICTHDRADLLERTLVSINAAKRPAMSVQIIVAANACTDDTVGRMQAYQIQQIARGWLPLRLIEVPTPGKSHALNRAIPEIETELTAFVDDDHRVDENYLVAIELAAQAWPEAGLYCGRILPDWDGTEPAWVHDKGPYRIYPLPVPRYDQGGATQANYCRSGPHPRWRQSRSAAPCIRNGRAVLHRTGSPRPRSGGRRRQRIRVASHDARHTLPVHSGYGAAPLCRCRSADSWLSAEEKLSAHPFDITHSRQWHRPALYVAQASGIWVS